MLSLRGAAFSLSLVGAGAGAARPGAAATTVGGGGAVLELELVTVGRADGLETSPPLADRLSRVEALGAMFGAVAFGSAGFESTRSVDAV